MMRLPQFLTWWLISCLRVGLSCLLLLAWQHASAQETFQPGNQQLSLQSAEACAQFQEAVLAAVSQAVQQDSIGRAITTLVAAIGSLEEPKADCSLDMLTQLELKLASLYRESGNYQLAYRYFFSGLNRMEQRGDMQGQAAVRLTLGEILMQQIDFKAAIVQFRLAVSFASARQQRLLSMRADEQLGYCYWRLQRADSAYLFYQLALEKAVQLKQDSAQARMHYQIGLLFSDGEQLDSQERAQRALQQALKAAQQAGYTQIAVASELAIAKLFYRRGLYSKTRQALERALAWAETLPSSQYLSETYLELSRLSRREQKTDEALRWVKRHLALQDSLQSEQNQADIRNRLTSFALFRKQAEIEQQVRSRKLKEQRLANQRIISLSLVGSTLTLAVVAALVYRDYRYQKRFARLLEGKNNEIQQRNQELQGNTEALREAEANLQAVNSTKDKFLSIISHDLKGPLNSLTGLLKILVNFGGQLAAEERQEFARNVLKSGRNLSQLLQNLLRWSEAQKGAVKFSPEYLSLWELAEEMLTMLQFNADNKNIRLHNLIPSNARAYADPDMMRFVMRNLISNSIKFTESGGQVWVHGGTSGPGRVFFQIKDNGVGMPPESVEKLFRLDAFHSTKGTGQEEGTGLGLILCHEFVKTCNGEISVSSKEGQGSSFTVTLPTTSQQALQPTA